MGLASEPVVMRNLIAVLSVAESTPHGRETRAGAA